MTARKAAFDEDGSQADSSHHGNSRRALIDRRIAVRVPGPARAKSKLQSATGARTKPAFETTYAR